VYFARCEGPWVEYPSLFGWDEICPVEAIAAGLDASR